VLVTAITRHHWRHARRRNSPVIVVDPGLGVDWWYPSTTHQPRSVDQPRKCGRSGRCACCGAESEAGGTLARQRSAYQLCPPPDRRSHGGPVTPVASAAAGTSGPPPEWAASRVVVRYLVHSEVAVRDNQGPVSGPGHGTIAGDGRLAVHVEEPPRPGRPGSWPTPTDTRGRWHTHPTQGARPDGARGTWPARGSRLTSGPGRRLDLPASSRRQRRLPSLAEHPVGYLSELGAELRVVGLWQGT
jgi:hypothetical protein